MTCPRSHQYNERLVPRRFGSSLCTMLSCLLAHIFPLKRQVQRLKPARIP